jgi:enamine deaminase RidA (YjgF/YER057c/UK114 family)
METTTRRPVNPSTWSYRLGFDQGLLTPAPSALLTIAAQGPLDGHGRLLHDGDPTAQLALTLANIAEVLSLAGMGWSDVVHLRVYTTDLETLLDAYDTLVEHLCDEGGARPPSTIVEVSRLLVPGMTVTIDGLAAR